MTQLAVLVGATVLALLASPAAAQKDVAAQSAPLEVLDEIVRIPQTGAPDGLYTRICRPKNGSPRGLVVINHGTSRLVEERKKLQPLVCGVIARFFLDLGFVVASPIRRGYGETGGVMWESVGTCDQPQFATAGRRSAEDILAAVTYLEKQPYVARGQTVIVGVSTGGWATLAYSGMALPGTLALINISGGRGGFRNGRPANNCAPDRLVDAAGELGAASRQPTLWIYSDNDLFFGPDLVRRMYAAYIRGGGKARLEMLPAYGIDGHRLFGEGIHFWGPVVERWLASPSP
jgi:dienelactone hydrolase